MPRDPDEVGASLVSISRETDRSPAVHNEVLEALRLIPTKLKRELAESGVRIILTPTIAEVVPNFDELAKSFGVDRKVVEEYAKGWPVLYRPVQKKIYVAESWQGYTGNSITYNVLNRCALALQNLHEFLDSKELHEVISADFACIPGDIMSPNISQPSEFYASIFAVVLMSESDQNFGAWPKGMTMMYPRTTRFVRATVNQFR